MIKNLAFNVTIDTNTISDNYILYHQLIDEYSDYFNHPNGSVTILQLFDKFKNSNDPHAELSEMEYLLVTSFYIKIQLMTLHEKI